ncbi:hypothetical protein ACO0SA_000601 [Hanseniaspora valbyensis]
MNNNNKLLQGGTKRSAFANVTEAVVNGRIAISENSLKNLKQYNNNFEMKKLNHNQQQQQPNQISIKKRILNQPLSQKEKENNNNNNITKNNVIPDTHTDNQKRTTTKHSFTKDNNNINNNNDLGNEGENDLLNSTKKTSLASVYNTNTNHRERDDKVQHNKRPISTFISHSDLKKIKFDKEEGEEDKEDEEEEEENREREIAVEKKQENKEDEDKLRDTAHDNNKVSAYGERDVVNDHGERDINEVLPMNHYDNMVTISGKTTDNVSYRYEDLDLEDSDDVLMVSEYVSEIFSYFYKSELDCLASPELMLRHPNINQNRDILVNWLVKIHNQFNLLPETLYLAVNIMDRFLCRELVALDKLQLVGTASLFIASKYEEVYSPSCKNFASVTDGACSEEDIKQGEVFILQTLNFKLDYPNPLNFLRRISKADEYHMDCRTVAKYLLEITIVDFRFVGIPPSKCAAAAFFLAKKMMGRPYWDGNFIHYSGGYSKRQLQGCVKMMMEYLEQPVIHEEFYKKYSTRRFCKASVASRDWAKRVIEQGFNVMDLHENNN